MSKQILPKSAADALRDLAAGKLLVGWPDGNKTAVYATEQREKRLKTGEPTPSIKKPVSLALIARTLNYGREPGVTLEGHAYGPIPARPFLDLAKKNVKKIMPALLRQNLPRLLSGRMSYQQFMALLGQRGADEIKKAMRSGNWQPLAESTIKRRRHKGTIGRAMESGADLSLPVGNNAEKPLIDTGTLVNSVSFEIRK